MAEKNPAVGNSFQAATATPTQANIAAAEQTCRIQACMLAS